MNARRETDEQKKGDAFSECSLCVGRTVLFSGLKSGGEEGCLGGGWEMLEMEIDNKKEQQQE